MATALQDLAFEEKNQLDEKAAKMTEEDALKLTDLLKQREKDLKQMTDQLKSKDESLSADTWFDAMVECIGYSQGIATQALKQLEKPILQSKEAYEQFEKLLNSKELLEYPDRVDGTKKVYQKHWSLLSQTTKQLAIMIAEMNQIIDIIEDYNETYKASKNNIDIDSISEVVDILNEWYKNAKNIGNLAKDWELLANMADNERTEWSKIAAKVKQDIKNTITSKKSILKGILVGLGVVAGVGLLCTGLGAISLGILGPIAMLATGAFTAVDIAIGGFLIVMGGIYGFAGGYTLYTQYNTFKCAKEGMRAAKATTEHIQCINETMQQIAADARAIQNAISKLNDECVENVSGQMKTLKSSLDVLKDDKATDARKNVKIKRIHKCINKIDGLMKEFKTECENCLNVTKKARENIVNLQMKQVMKN